MKIDWHCAGCNELGSFEVTLDDLVKGRKKEDMITLLITWTEVHIHPICEHKNIGVKLHA